MVTQTIPASKIVNMSPGVVAAGGSALDFTGVILTTNTRVPIGMVYSFGSTTDVAAFFGGGSAEAALAAVYFTGPDDGDLTPAALFFAQYPQAAVAGYVQGGAGLTLAQVQAIVSGTLAVTVDGTLKTSSALNLSSATSLSNAASLIQAAFTTPGFTVTYDSTAGAFIITSGTTGAASSIAVTTGANATALKLTAATGAVTSPGAIAAVPGTFMDALVALTQDFLSFTYAFEPNTADCLAFAAWTSGKKNRYIHSCWDTDVNNTSQAPTTTVLAQIIAAGYSGTIVTYAPVNGASAGVFVLSFFASLDFTKLEGRKTLAFRSQAGLLPDVTSGTVYDQLMANGLNFYGAYSSANNARNIFYPGSISGKFLWADSYANQVWLNDALQVALIDLLTSVGSVPFNASGDALVAAACNDPITAAVNFGAIRAGITLSAAQKAETAALAGTDISSILQTQGWYLKPGVSTASPATRQARGPVTPTLWYTDGQSVQSINFTSLEVL